MENPLGIQASLKLLCVERTLAYQACFLTSGISDDDDGTFALAVADEVAEHASKSREHWRLELANVDEV